MSHPNLEPENPQDIPGNNEEQVPAWQAAVFAERNGRLQAEARAVELERQLNTRNVEPQTPIEIPEGEPFSNPTAFLGRIRDEMNRTIAPLNNFVAETQRQQEYFRMKGRIKSTLDQNALNNFNQIEHLVDGQFLNNTQLRPDQPTLETVITNIVGTLALSGRFPNSSNNRAPAPTNTNRSDMIPPNIRPAAAPINNSTANEPSMDEFTENERRLMKEQRLTPGEFKRMRDCTPDQSNRVWKEIIAERKAKGGK